MTADVTTLWEELAQRDDLAGAPRIVYLIHVGLGGVSCETAERTALQTARTPNLDRLAGQSSCGLLGPIGPGITSGSGPGFWRCSATTHCTTGSTAACCSPSASISLCAHATLRRG